MATLRIRPGLRKSAPEPIAHSEVRRTLARTAQHDQLLLEQEILSDDGSHAAGSAELRGCDGQVKQGEQEILHARDSVGQNSGATQWCPRPRFSDRIRNSRPTGAGDRPVHVLIDSTGLRIHVGHLRKPPKHRAWRKLHVAVDARTGEIVASALTSRRVRDGAQAPTLLGQIDQRVASVSADSAYDTERVYEAAHAQGDGRAVRVCIPPGRNAQLSPRPSAALKERNRNVRSINKLGRREWPKRTGYSRRAMVENTIYRYKTIIGRAMTSRTLVGQRVEVRLACRVLNTMTRLGMPDSYRVA